MGPRKWENYEKVVIAQNALMSRGRVTKWQNPEVRKVSKIVVFSGKRENTTFYYFSGFSRPRDVSSLLTVF